MTRTHLATTLLLTALTFFAYTAVIANPLITHETIIGQNGSGHEYSLHLSTTLLISVSLLVATAIFKWKVRLP